MTIVSVQELEANNLGYIGKILPNESPYRLLEPIAIVDRPLQEKGTITTVYDMASLVTTCCIDIFDQNHVPEDFQFFEYFERSISIVVRLTHLHPTLCF